MPLFIKAGAMAGTLPLLCLARVTQLAAHVWAGGRCGMDDSRGVGAHGMKAALDDLPHMAGVDTVRIEQGRFLDGLAKDDSGEHSRCQEGAS